MLATKDHVINPFRHAFEKRMEEADIDYALRCTLMGNKNTCLVYCDGQVIYVDGGLSTSDGSNECLKLLPR